MNRFARTELLFGPAAMERLRQARVAVVGLGAVGSYAVEGLARAGVGFLRLVDFDVIHPSNFNRQLFALDSTLGRFKADVARERVLDIHPACQIEALRLFVDRDTAPAALAGPLDVVIDAVDSLGPKTELLAAAVNAGTRVISSMGAATRTDPAAIRVSDISQTSRCPLARLIRKQLRARGIASGITCVYSVENPIPVVSNTPASPIPAEAESFPRGRERKPLGSFSCLTGIFGLIAAREAVMPLLRQ